jgi:hypothetical protein
VADKLGVTGLIAKFILDEFKRNVREYDKLQKKIQKETEKTAKAVTKSGADMSKALDSVAKSAVSAGGRTLRFGDSLNNVDWETYNRLVGEGKSATDAFAEASVAAQGAVKESAEEAADGTAKLSETLVNTAGKIAAYAAAFSIAKAAVTQYINAVKTSISESQELADEIRRVQLQTGMSTREAQLWVTAADVQNVSARSLAAGFAQVSRNLTNMQLRIAAGKEDNTTFARTLRAIGVESKNLDGTFKSTAEITEEVNEFIRQLGPGWQAAGVAQNIYGRGAANILPIILDQTVSLEELNKLLVDGAQLTEADVKASRELTLATLKVDAAKQRLKNTLAREWIPTWAVVLEGWAKALNLIDQVDKKLRAFFAASRAVGAGGSIFSKEFGDVYQETLNRLNAETEEAVEAESKLTAERQAAIDAIFAETDATDDLAKEQEKLIEKLSDLAISYEQRQEDIALRFSRRWADIQTRRWFDEIERTMRFTNRLNELYIKNRQKVADIEAKRGQGVKEAQDKVNKKLRDADKDAQLRREKLARSHQDKLVDIQNDYLDSVEEAARSNDAVAVLKARRRRARAIREEGLNFARSQREQEIDLKTKRDKIREDAAARKKEEQDNYDEQIARANLEYQRQIEALKRRNAQDTVLRNLKFQEDKHAFDVAKRRAFQDAEIWYNREREALKEQMAELNIIIVDGVAQIGASVAAETGKAVTAIANAAAAAAEAAARQWINRHAYLGGATTPPGTGRAGIDEWYRRTQPGGYRARGGFDIARRPTRYMAGDEGTPEMAVFIPMREGQLNHQIGGRMGVDFSGMPPGMDQTQIEAIIWTVMNQIVEQAGVG